jgi:hypothetical protein
LRGNQDIVEKGADAGLWSQRRRPESVARVLPPSLCRKPNGHGRFPGQRIAG